MCLQIVSGVNARMHNPRLFDLAEVLLEGGGAEPPLEFGRSVNTIQIRGADYAPHTTASPRIQKAIYTSALHSDKSSVST